MAWCEANRVDYVFGLARNDRLERGDQAESWPRATDGKPRHRQAGAPLQGLPLATLKSWSRERRVIGKAEWTGGEANPRFVVTSLKPAEIEAGAASLREALLRPRRDGEPHQGMPARPVRRPHLGRDHARQPAAAVVRLDLAYVLLCALRRIGLAHTQFANATCGTIRLKLLKIGALVRISVRRINIAMASACPWQHEFALAHALLRRRRRLSRNEPDTASHSNGPRRRPLIHAAGNAAGSHPNRPNRRGQPTRRTGNQPPGPSPPGTPPL